MTRPLHGPSEQHRVITAEVCTLDIAIAYTEECVETMLIVEPLLRRFGKVAL